MTGCWKSSRQLQVTRETKIWGVGHSSPNFLGCPDFHDTQSDCATVYDIKTSYLIISLLEITDSRIFFYKFPSSSIFNRVNVCFCFNSTSPVDLAIQTYRQSRDVMVL